MLSYEEILILLQIGSQGCDSWIKTGYLLVVVTDSEVNERLKRVSVLRVTFIHRFNCLYYN